MADPRAEKLAKELKDSLSQRRSRPWKFVLASLAGGVLLLALLGWLLYPQPKTPPLQVIALDAICTPEDTPMARAQLLRLPDDKGTHRLSGRTIVFHEQPLLLAPNRKPREIVAQSDERGQASVEWPVGQAVLTEFLVLHVDAEQRRGSPHERGRIFVWPRDAALLIVDADQTLIGPPFEVKAPATLAKAAKEGWHIVYLALAHARPHDFRKARDWIEKQAELPKGPVLGRLRFTDELTAEQARRDVLKELKGQFPRSLVAVVKNVESAKSGEELGVTAIMLGGAETPAWADVRLQWK